MNLSLKWLSSSFHYSCWLYRLNNGEDCSFVLFFPSTVRSFCWFPNGILSLIFSLVSTSMWYIQEFIFFKIFTICIPHPQFFFLSLLLFFFIFILFQSQPSFSPVTLCKCPCFSPLSPPAPAPAFFLYYGLHVIFFYSFFPPCLLCTPLLYPGTLDYLPPEMVEGRDHDSTGRNHEYHTRFHDYDTRCNEYPIRKNE